MTNEYILNKVNEMKGIEEIKAKFKEACEKAWNLNIKAENESDDHKRLRHLEQARKLQNQAIALGWVLGIDKADVVCACDPEE